MALQSTVLEGPDVVLVSCTPEDAAELWPLTDSEAWRGMTKPWPSSAPAFAAFIADQLATPGLYPFTVRDAVTREARGATTLYDHVPAQRRIEIGTTWYGRAFWGGTTNPAAKLLLLTHAFEHLGVDRVALRCDSRNLRSAAAIQRLGATPEGVLRRHRVNADGSTGDTAYFSIIRAEWPAVRQGLRDRLTAAGVADPR